MKNSKQHFLNRFQLACVVLFSIHSNAQGAEVKTVILNNRQLAPITVSMRGAVISFPAKPSKVILGNAGSFGLEYVENDVALSPLKPQARSNLFVYLYGRRFAFDLKTSGTESGVSLVIVRDGLAEVPHGQ